MRSPIGNGPAARDRHASSVLLVVRPIRGCGGGLLLRDAARTGALATGLDHSEEMVRLARERAPGAEVRLGNAEALPFPPASFTARTQNA